MLRLISFHTIIVTSLLSSLTHGYSIKYTSPIRKFKILKILNGVLHIKHTIDIKSQLKSHPIHVNSDNNIIHPMRVAYQGEPGAYSEKAARELLVE